MPMASNRASLLSNHCQPAPRSQHPLVWTEAMISRWTAPSAHQLCTHDRQHHQGRPLPDALAQARRYQATFLQDDVTLVTRTRDHALRPSSRLLQRGMSRRSLSERPEGSASTLLVAVYPGPGMHLDVSWSNQVSAVYRCRFVDGVGLSAVDPWSHH